MKKFIVLLVAISTLTGCQVEPLDPGVRSSVFIAGILGTWNLEDFNITTSSTSTFAGATVTLNTETSLVSTDATITFNNDGTFISTGTITLETTANGMSTGNQTSSFVSTGTYEVDGDQLAIIPDNNAGNVNQVFSNDWQTISNFTPTTLRLESNINVDDSQNGIDAQIAINSFTTFSR